MLNTQIGRLRAEELLELIDLNLATGQAATEEIITQYRSTLRERMGTPMLTRPIVTAETHSEGIAQLQALNNKILGAPAGNVDPQTIPDA